MYPGLREVWVANSRKDDWPDNSGWQGIQAVTAQHDGLKVELLAEIYRAELVCSGPISKLNDQTAADEALREQYIGDLLSRPRQTARPNLKARALARVQMLLSPT